MAVIEIIDYMDLPRGPRPTEKQKQQTIMFIREWVAVCHRCGHTKVNHTALTGPGDAPCFYEDIGEDVCGCAGFMVGPAPTQWERLLADG